MSGSKSLRSDSLQDAESVTFTVAHRVTQLYVTSMLNRARTGISKYLNAINAAMNIYDLSALAVMFTFGFVLFKLLRDRYR